MARSALIASLDYWTSPFQLGGHHVARGLADLGWTVGYVSWPISPLHLLGGNREALRRRFAIYRAGGVEDADGRIWAYVPGVVAAPHGSPLLRSAWLHRNWPRLTLPPIDRQLRRQGLNRVDLLYLDVPIHQRFLSTVQSSKSVFRIADRLSGFKHLAPAMVELESEVATSVDLVVYTAATLAPHVAAMAPRRMLHLPNGVDVDHFTQVGLTVPDDLRTIPRPIAIYVGALQDWFDWALVDRLTDQMPDVSFVIVGPDELARTRLATRSNLHLLGRRPYDEVPRYLAHSDVGLIPFDVARHAELVNSVHPLKLYEYLAAGLSVVAAEWPELASLDSPAILARSGDEFVAGIRQALTSPLNRPAARTFVESATWGQRIGTLLEALDLV